MDSPAPTTADFVTHWEKVGPVLAAQRQRELMDLRHAEAQYRIDALLQAGLQHRQCRTTTGLVELQRRLSEPAQ